MHNNRLIPLSRNAETIYVNPDRVAWIEPNPGGGGSTVYFSGILGDCVLVDDSASAVAELIASIS